VAHDDEFTVRASSANNGQALDVLANDETQPGETLRIVEVSEPEHGQVHFGDVGQLIIFVPDPDFVGSTRFEYVVSDGRGGRDSAAVIVHVVGEVDPADINGDRDVSPLDILIMLNQMQRPNVPMEDDRDGDLLHFDVNGDGIFSLRDVLMVINRVNRRRFHAQVAADAVAVPPPSDENVQRPGMDENADPTPLPSVAPFRVDDRPRHANAKGQPQRDGNELEDILVDIQRDVAGQWNQ
jgi:hypothetical protein